MVQQYINARIYRRGNIELGNFTIADGRIVDCDPAITPDEVIDMQGALLTAGLVDVHVHLREPGLSHKETIATGTAAAARGGYTTICSMPNVVPAPDCSDSLKLQEQIIERDARVRVLPYASITMGQRGEGELVDFEALSERVFAFSDDGRGVQSDSLMLAAMERAAAVGRAIVAHCEVEELLQGGYIHDGEYCKRNGHKGISSESEWRQIERDIAAVEKTGVQYHVCHISTKESVELVRKAKAKGLNVTCETAPHYLLLCDEDLQEDGRFKMNPPLRSVEDRAALVAGIKDGTIDMIATDHAPHTAEEKSKGLQGSAMGVVGLECSFGVLYKHLVVEGVISLERLLELMAYAPRRIFGIRGGLEVGDVADFAAFDLDAEWSVVPAEFLSKGRATPFEGWAAQGEAILTVVGGETVYERVSSPSLRA